MSETLNPGCTHALPVGSSCGYCNADIGKLKELQKPLQLTPDEMLSKLADLVNQTSLGKMAKAIGVSKSYLSKVVAGELPVSDKVAAHFGYKKFVIYKAI